MDDTWQVVFWDNGRWAFLSETNDLDEAIDAAAGFRSIGIRAEIHRIF
jgi:hypothetical protein